MAVKQTTVLIFILIIVLGVLPIFVYVLDPRAASYTNTLASLPSRNLPPFEQQAQALAGLFVKPMYMLLSLVIILALLGQKNADLIALKWGQVAFLVGEIFCAVNFYIYQHESFFSEYLHSYGMALAFGLTAFALLEGLDSRFLRLTNSKSACEAWRVCGHCTRHDSKGCKARIIARFALPLLAVLAFIPLAAPLQPNAYAVSIFGFPYSYIRFDVYAIYERRVLPALAVIAFLIAYLPLLKKSEPPIPFVTKIFTCAGLGALGFSFFRVVLNAIFFNNLVWFEFWEETTELMFVGMLGFVLWQFQEMLLKDSQILIKLGLKDNNHL